MKKLYTLLSAVILTTSAFAQAPEKMSYQAVVRDAVDALVTSTSVGMQISIINGSVSGTAVYIETQTPTTNINGLASVEIGSGTIVSGTFNSIDWGAGPYFIKTEIDPTGGTNYTITGTSQLMSVPYALMAQDVVNSIWSKTGTDISYVGDNVGIGVANPSHPLHMVHSTTTSNAVSIEAGSPPSARDVLEIKVDAGTSDNAQFIEMERGTSIVAAVNANGSAEFLNVTVEENLDNTTIPDKGKIYANGLPIAYGYVSSGVTTATLITDFGITSVSKPASTTGEYRIILNRTVVGQPVIIATSLSASPNDEIVTANRISATEIEINIADGTGAGTNSNFYFVVFGEVQ